MHLERDARNFGRGQGLGCPEAVWTPAGYPARRSDVRGQERHTARKGHGESTRNGVRGGTVPWLGVFGKPRASG
jgi:hypothetical protein